MYTAWMNFGNWITVSIGLEIELVGRMLVACLCGIILGFERHTRAKEAGMRTHCIVACASALMMIVSKYGFFDLVESSYEYASDVRLDPSRMAQGIVTGVGFLGAGIIYFQRGVLKGLTTAAGIWAVSGIGMAIGAGMYIIGIAATVIVLLIQIILHRRSALASGYKTKTIKIYDVEEDGFQQNATAEFKELDISVVDVSISRNINGNLDYLFCIEVPQRICEESLINIFDYRAAVDFTH